MGNPEGFPSNVTVPVTMGMKDGNERETLSPSEAKGHVAYRLIPGDTIALCFTG